LTCHNARAILPLTTVKIKTKQNNTTMKKQKNTFIRVLSVTSLVAILAVQVFPISTASAAQITNRSLTLMSGAGDSNSDGVTDGGALPGGIVNHGFKFNLTGNNGVNVGSIKFQYCTTAAPVPNGLDCNVPVGLSTVGTNIGNQSGAAGFVNVNSTTNGTVVISRASAAEITGAASVATEYRLDGITNPIDNTNDPTGMTFFVRVSTHTALDGSGSSIDSGTVAAATNYDIVLDGTMPESLVFCTGATIGQTSGVPDCATATSGAISFNQLFSPTDTATATSQMAASTNAGTGYAITVNGPTLTSGSNTIPGMAASGPIVRGTGQFGLNLVPNTTATSTVAVGTAVAPVSDSTNYYGQPHTLNGYGTPDNFKFVPGQAVANSADSASNVQVFTVSYIANVPGNQPAGTYVSTLTYICTPTF
jgi:hypothetical protein